MTAISQISERQSLNRNTVDDGLTESVLDLLPDAYLLAKANGKLELGNAKAVELSGYTRKELSQLSIKTLLPSVKIPLAETQSLASISNKGVPLITRRSTSVEVQLHVVALAQSGGLMAVRLRKMSAVAEEAIQASRGEARWKAMQVLLLAGQQKDLPSSYRQILQAGNLLTSAQHLALYTKSDGVALRLSAVHGSGLEFPATLSTSETAPLREPAVWKEGRSIKSELHRLAHTEKLPYLATTPLDLTSPESGLLVATDRKKSPSDDLLTLMQVLAASAATTRIQMDLMAKMEAQIKVLSKNSELSHKLEDRVQDGIIYLNQDLMVMGINQAAQSMLGYSENEALGRSANNILISSHPLLNTLVRAQSGEVVSDIGDIKLHRRDGSDLLSNVRIERMEQEDGAFQIVLFMSDLSENEALHVQSQQLQQRAWLGEVTAIFAHEVRNPINNISTGLQLMQLNFEENDPIQEQITALQEDCDRLDHRMKSVLSFSRSMKHNPAPIDLGQFCNEQIMRWKPKMARNQIDAHLTVDANAPMIMGDRQALDQVFTNLINNSIQAMSDTKNGIIAIKIKDDPQSDNSLALHFSDNGPGIPEDLVKRVFDPFFTTKESEGTGLGLAITKRIIQAHKGEIELESFPGGTLFKIKIPRIQTQKDPA